jgi:glycosyltransferase involved in cell wall biosynthesis
VELAAASGRRRRLAVRRWYSFARMQASVARRLPALTTVSASARADIERDFRVPAGRVRVIPVGVEADVFRPPGDVATGGGQPGRVAGRLVVTTSADVPLKGLVPLLEAVAKLATERQVELVVVGTARPGGAAQKAIDRLALRGTVRFVSGLTDDGLADLLRSASVAVVPSLYEGFSLPAVEAMACATPLVATTAGALPEVVGPDGEAALHVPPGDPERMAAAIGRVLDDPGLGERLGAAGRERVLRRYTWRATAAATADWYAEVLGRRAGRSPGAGAASAGRRSGGC